MSKTEWKGIQLDKSMYKRSGQSFTQVLEQMDPSGEYEGTGLEGLDAFERQLKRFDIKVSGRDCDMLEKFFISAQSATLFPEYVSRAVRQGMQDADRISDICASKVSVAAMDYRTIDMGDIGGYAFPAVNEGSKMPETVIKLSDELVSLKKRGRVLSASYEAVRFQKLDVFTVALRQIGQHIAKAQLADAVNVLTGGSGADMIQTAGSALTYGDLVALWNTFNTFDMNTLLASPDMVAAMLSMEEFQQPASGFDFMGSGKLGTPLGASLINCRALPAGTILGLDRRFALQMISAAEVHLDCDKLIDCQLERAAISSVTGFSKIFPDAVKGLELR